MDRWITLCATACLLLASLASAASVAENEVYQGRSDESGPASLLGDLRFVYRLYSDCDASPAGASSCLKLKLASAVDRAVRKERMTVMDGVEFVKSGESSESSGNPATEEELEAALPRSLTERETALDGLILDKVLAFFQTHTLQFKLADAEKLGRSLVGESARGKLKKIGPLLLLPLLFGATLIPIALGKLALLAGKALIIAKLALVLSAIIGLKKLLGGGGGGSGHDSSYQVVSGGGGWNGGHYSRSLEAAVPLQRDARADPQPLAYRAHAARSMSP